MCILHGEHKNHESVLVKQEIESCKVELQKKLDKFGEISKEIQRAKGDIEATKDGVNKVYFALLLIGL